MGSYLFSWDQPANEVFVTGTFDDWAKSIRLDKKGSAFEKRVELPATGSKIYYKFVVDGNWTTNPNEPQETDDSNIVNNFLTADKLEKTKDMSNQATGATISGVTPSSTTAKLAGDVPKETSRSKDEAEASDAPGAFPPETPYHDAEEFSVKPIPASSGVGNPISLKPGERVPDPSEFSTNDTTTADTLDKESYEKSGDGPSALAGASTIQSSGANTTTAALAGQVPKEPREEGSDNKLSAGLNTGTPIANTVPDVVQESITASNNAPEAAANKEAVKEKAAVENELLKDVKMTDAQGEPAPSTSATVAEKAPAATATQDTKGSTEAAASPVEQKAKKTDGPDSRDVSPLSHPKGPHQPAQPTVTTGPATSTAPETSKATENSISNKAEAPASPVSNTSASASTDKKAKRGSIFGRLKEKFKHEKK